jgi:hypothetical protein
MPAPSRSASVKSSRITFASRGSVLSQEETSQPGRKVGSVSGGGIRRKREGGAGESSLMLAKRVLVVEDDALVSMAVEAEIAGCDHAVVGPFGSGADALASLGFVEPPDAAVIDLRLRDGSCLDLARALRRCCVPFLVYTGCLAPVEVPAIFEPRLGSRSRP